MSVRTKKHIVDTALELLKEKSIEDIRISEICSRAEIDRGTFYYHFRDKYDLFAWYYTSMADLINWFDPEEAAKGLARMKKELVFYRKVYDYHGQNAVSDHIYQYCYDNFATALKRKLNTRQLDKDLDLELKMYCHGSLALAKDWTFNDDVTPARDMARKLWGMTPERIRKLLFDTAE